MKAGGPARSRPFFFTRSKRRIRTSVFVQAQLYCREYCRNEDEREYSEYDPVVLGIVQSTSHGYHAGAYTENGEGSPVQYSVDDELLPTGDPKPDGQEDYEGRHNHAYGTGYRVGDGRVGTSEHEKEGNEQINRI